VIADVSGKGPAAALYMAMARSLLRTAAARSEGPSAALAAVEAALREQSSARLFVTVFLGLLDPARRILTWASAGHNPPLLRRHSAPERVEDLPLGGTALGLGAPDLGLADRALSLEPGDALVLHTDGVGDAEDPEGAMYGSRRLEAAVASAPGGARELLAHVLRDLEGFTRGAPQADDVDAPRPGRRGRRSRGELELGGTPFVRGCRYDRAHDPPRLLPSRRAGLVREPAR
jgi:sigma-B regulation protein RsbU (phosphoserine phosphatase)